MHLSREQMELLNEHDIQTLPQAEMYFGYEYGRRHPVCPGRHPGYYFRYKGKHVAALGFVGDTIYFEALDSVDNNGNFIFKDVQVVDSLDDAVGAVLTAAVLLRVNGHFEESNF